MPVEQLLRLDDLEHRGDGARVLGGDRLHRPARPRAQELRSDLHAHFASVISRFCTSVRKNGQLVQIA